MQEFLGRAERNGGLSGRVLHSGILTAGQLQQLRNNLVVRLPFDDGIMGYNQGHLWQVGDDYPYVA